jgi:hypothetical protein
LQFLVDVLPSNATNKDVNWSVVPYAGTGTGTINPTSGLFTGNVAGTVTVRANATDGSNVYGDKQITISPASVPVTGINVTPNTAQTITAGQTVQFTANVIPINADDLGIDWSIISGGSGGTVSQTGLFTGSVSGLYVVRAAASGNPSALQDISVDVSQPADVSSCDGCRAFALRVSESTTTYPYWCYSNVNGYCWISARPHAGKYISYKVVNGAYQVYSTGTTDKINYSCEGGR